MPIIALTATLTSPMSGMPTKTSPKINNASLTCIGRLQELEKRLVKKAPLTLYKYRMINDLCAIFANQTLLSQV